MVMVLNDRPPMVMMGEMDSDMMLADLEMAAFMGPDAILIPKVEDGATVQTVAARLAVLGPVVS